MIDDDFLLTQTRLRERQMHAPALGANLFQRRIQMHRNPPGNHVADEPAWRRAQMLLGDAQAQRFGHRVEDQRRVRAQPRTPACAQA